MRSDIILCCADLSFSRMLVLELEELHLSVRHYTMLPDRLPDLIKKISLLIADTDLQDVRLSNALQLAEEYAVPVILFGRELSPPEKLRLTIPTQNKEEDTPLFLHRPFLIEEFLSYIGKILADCSQPQLLSAAAPALSAMQAAPVERIRFAHDTKSVYFDEDEVHLTRREYALLLYLCQHKGRVVGRKELLRAVWHDDTHDPGIVNVYIRYLRAKIDDVYQVRLICNVRGTGYLIHNS